MLFQRLYNWIKYKTLPSSFLFKNRLFVERDSKHRRIFNNLGLTFRNSTWANYEMYNVKLHFQWVYVKYIIFFLSVILFFYFFLYYRDCYLLNYFFNDFFFFFWTGVDIFDYYLSFFVWTFTVFSSLLFNFIYSYFFFSRLTYKAQINDSTRKLFNNSLPTPVPSCLLQSPLTKHDYSWALYFWLTNSQLTENSFAITTLYDKAFDSKNWDSYSNFFLKLYKTSFFCSLSIAGFSGPYLKNLINEIEAPTIAANFALYNKYTLSRSYLTEYPSVFFYYALLRQEVFKNSRLQDTSNLYSLNNRFTSNLSNIQLMRNNTVPTFLYLRGPFYFFNNLLTASAPFFANFPELRTLPQIFKHQNETGKWDRWLYKYSILHRKIFKNSHKIVLTKRLLNSSFLDSNLFRKNIWATDQFAKQFNNENSTKSVFTLLHSNLFFNQSLTVSNNVSNYYFNNNNSTQFNLHLLNYYETSYFWFIKRFYLLNTLSTNRIHSFPKLIRNLNSTKSTHALIERNLDKYSNLFNMLLKLHSFRALLFSDPVLLQKYENLLLKSCNNSQYPAFDPLSKTLYSLTTNFDLLTADILHLLSIIVNGAFHNNNVAPFSYLSTSASFDPTPTSLSFSVVRVNQCPNTDYLWNFLNLDFVFFKDVLFYIYR